MEDYLKFGAISRRPDEKVRVGSEDSGGSARVRRSCCHRDGRDLAGNREGGMKLFLMQVRARVIEPHSRTLELPLLVRSSSFFSFLVLSLGREASFRCALAPLYPIE